MIWVLLSSVIKVIYQIILKLVYHIDRVLPFSSFLSKLLLYKMFVPLYFSRHKLTEYDVEIT